MTTTTEQTPAGTVVSAEAVKKLRGRLDAMQSTVDYLRSVIVDGREPEPIIDTPVIAPRRRWWQR